MIARVSDFTDGPQAHEAAGSLLSALEYLGFADADLEAARQQGMWGNYRTGDDSARNAMRDVQTKLRDLRGRLEGLLAAAANTRAGEALSLREDPARRKAVRA